MKKKSNLFATSLFPLAVTAAALIQFTMPAASAATLYWDTNGSTVGAGGTTPAATWSTSGTTWSTSSQGTATTSAYTTALTDDLFFSAGVDATGAYTITLNDPQNAKSLTFDEGTATISGSGGGVINLGGTGSIWASNGATAFIGNNTDTTITSSTGLTKAGVGTLTLNGSTVNNSLTGGLTINGGTLALDHSNLTTPTDLVNSGNALAMGTSGNLLIKGSASGDTSQTLGNVTMNSGGGSILINPNGGTSTTLTLGSLTTTAGSSLLVGKALSAGAGTAAITTTTDVDANGIYGGRVLFANGTANTGYDWATNTGGSGPYTLAAYTGYTTLPTSGGSSTTNYLASASTTLAGDVSVNTLKIGNANLTATGFTLTVQSGGILFTSGVTGSRSITGGILTAGNGSGSYELIFNQYNVGPLSITSAIQNNGSNPVTLVKNGPGTLNFTTSTTNSFTGEIILNGGTLTLGSGSNSIPAIPNGNSVTVNANSSFSASSGQSYTSNLANLTINNGSYLGLATNVSTLNFSGPVTGAGGGISVGISGSGAQILNFNSTSNTFTGIVEYKNLPGLSGQNALLAVNSFADSDTYGAGNIRFGVVDSTTVTHTETFKFGGSSGTPTGPLVFNNRQIEIAGLSTYLFTPVLENGTSQAFTINSDLLASGAGTRTLTLQGTGSGLSTFAGSVTNGNLTSLGITKAGTGTWSLSNASNNFDGAITFNTTTTSAGKLSYASALGTNPIAFNQTTNSATLSYIGSASQTMSGAITASALTSGTITLDSSGAGAVNYSNSGSLGSAGSGAKTLSLTGTSTGNNILAGGWVDNTGAGAKITKSGAGKWILSGTNNYSGTTTISAGTLALGANNALPATTAITLGSATLNAATFKDTTGTLDVTDAASTINLGSGAALAFADSSGVNFGTWSGTLNITGTFVSGNGVDPGVSTNPGSLRFGTDGTALTSTQLASITVTGWTDFALDDYGFLTATPTGGPGPVDHFDISAIASPQTVGTPITGITLTAKDASNATATGFTGTVTFGGTGGFTGTSASFTAGVLSGVSVTPGVAGSNLTFTVNDGASHTGSTTITTIQTQYEAWAGGASFDTDANGDGIKNGLAWLLGASSPTSAVTTPTVSQSGGNLTMSFSMLNAAKRGSAVLNVQHSSDLGITDAWTTVPVPDSNGGPTSGVTFTVTPGSPSNSVTATISNTEAASGKLFGRLKANP